MVEYQFLELAVVQLSGLGRAPSSPLTQPELAGAAALITAIEFRRAFFLNCYAWSRPFPIAAYYKAAFLVMTGPLSS